MSYLHCPVCGLNVPRSRGMKSAGEDCPRCLARSSGTESVKLASGRAHERKASRNRVTALLRELRPSTVKR
jgi:hypothetical protein